MELIFAYIKKFGGFIYEQSIPLSNDFEVHLENKVLTVREKKNYLKDFYGDGIKNISVFVGKNGSGKTTLLDILGMKRQDRLIGSVKKNEVNDEYLLLYYLGNNGDGQELFGIEVLGSNVFYNMFTNYDRGDDDDRYDKGKVSIGLVFRYENGCFVSMGKHFFNEIEENKLSDLIRYAYINESYRYSKRNEHYGIYNQREDDYIAKRKMYPHSNVYTKYLLLCQCIENEIKGFDFDKVKVRLYDEIDYSYKMLIVIMDEPDQALHPEWARRFIDIIVSVLGKSEFACNIQLILSTHSPYLLSDILPSDVFLLEKLGDERKLSVRRMDMIKGNSCFGANVYDLMKNQLFMENTVGEFATRKLNNLAREIDGLDCYNDKNIEKIEYFVDQIGEMVIRKILKKKLEDKKQKLRLLNNRNSILEMITNQDDKQRIKEYLEMLEDK